MLVTPPTIDKITIGRYASPIGIGESRPRLSWRFAQDSSTSPNFVQRKYELEIFRDDLGSAVYFPTSEINVGVPWPSDTERDEKPLKSREKGTIHVRACGEDELWTEWHKQEFEVGLLEDEDWSAEFVTTDIKPPSQLTKRPFYTRTEFRLDQTALDGMRKDGRGARIYATALGVYQLELNGHRVGDHVLAPGWQSYNHRLHYQTYVVPAELFKHGDNVIGAVVGEGWYAGHLTWSPYFRNIWGEEIGVRVQLEFPGGVSNLTVAETISSGEGWQWTYGPLLASELYDGETFDVSLIDPKWSTIESKSIWRPVKTLPLPSSTKLIAPEAPPIRRMLEVKPTELISTPKGKKIIDFGQNIAGWAKVKIIPPGSGKVVTLRFAEVLDRGELGVRPLRSAKATDTVFLGPNEVKDWEPSFTTHGFRYLEVNGMEAELENFIAVVVHSDMERLGDFRCSHEMINKLHENVVWGLRGNFVGVPTDCPQRDERLGWTGDIQVFTPTASFLFDTSGFLANWLHDLSEETLKDNMNVPPVVVPDVLSGRDLPRGKFPQSVWSDVVALAPDALHTAYGSSAILEELYEAMTAWLDKGVPRSETGLWLNPPDGFQFADWLDPAAPPEDAAKAMTDPFLVADAYLVHVTSIVSQVANVLKRSDDHTRYSHDHSRLRKAFQEEYMTTNGRLASDAQTAFALALEFHLLDHKQVDHAAERLVRLVTKNGFKIGTGFAGTNIILKVLTENGQLPVAYRMLQEKGCPSWLYPITMGATTVWERWDSLLPDGSINPGEMTSFNHYALGSVAHFLHTVIGGLTPAEPGWKKIRIEPRPGGTVNSANTHHLTPYGRVACVWNIEGSQMSVDIEVPPNTIAKVILPGETKEVGSGMYHFEVKYKADPRWPPKAQSSPLPDAGPQVDSFVP